MSIVKREPCYVCGAMIKTFLGFGWCSRCANRAANR